MRLGRYLWSLVVDHQAKCSHLYFHHQCAPALQQDICQRLESVTSQLSRQSSNGQSFKLLNSFSPTLSQSQYHSAIAQIKEYILSGDCYQVNFTQHLSAHYQGDLWQAYLTLRDVAPSPYSVYWQWADKAILSLSPERFIKSEVSDGQINIETKPIKGTVLRGETDEEDQRNAEQLLNSSKDRAENLMIVDLLRNDLSKNCRPGSIHVPKLFNLESFPNVHHLVSTVTGVLDANSTLTELLRDSFPGGSITGAPKKRAMEIIDELEPIKRSVYCGSIGYICASNRMDTNIAIRTLVVDDKQIHCWGGGGIVADSEADKEFDESMNKIRLLLDTLENM
jgi:para-aminobenzoate synthetase component 1